MGHGTNGKQMFPDGLSTKEAMNLKKSPGPIEEEISMRDNKVNPQFRSDNSARLEELQRENENLRLQI